MIFFSEKDKERINKAIIAAEKKTSGEIIAVVTQQSDDYRFIALLWAALIALLIPAILIFLPSVTNWFFSFQPAENIFFIQLIAFIILATAFQWHPVRFSLTPAYIKQKRAHKHAKTQFIAQGLHATTHRNGIMLFISLSERYIEVMANKAIYENTTEKVWPDIIAAMEKNIENNQPTQAFLEAIEICAKLLAEHFPDQPVPHNELTDHLIEL